jgi:uncharacterized glyoxalase superfamily protein PhnB
MTLRLDVVQLHVHSFESGGALGGGAVYFFVDDVNALHATLAGGGAAIPNGPFDQTWGTREIGVRDPDGNTLTFGERIRNQEPGTGDTE